MWYEDGQKQREESYKNDERHGKWIYWFDNGRLEKEEKYSNGVQTDGKHYDYFWNFYYESFYISKDTDTCLKIRDFFSKLLILHLPKTKSELDIFAEIYIILDKNLIVEK